MADTEISKKAVELVNGERQATYGHPYHNFVDIGRIWGSILDIPDIDPEKVALMMMGVKISRLKHKYHEDGNIDFFGYENCLDQIISYKKKLIEESMAAERERIAKHIQFLEQHTTSQSSNTAGVEIKAWNCLDKNNTLQ